MTEATTPCALDALKAVASEADAAERRLRASFAEEIVRLETERRRAYRRWGFLKALIDADAGAADREGSRAAQRAAAADELEWDAIDSARRPVLDALEPLADAVHDARLRAEGGSDSQATVVRVAATRGSDDASDGDAGIDLLQALLAFEAWYESVLGRPFVANFDRTLAETPLVDF
ncbi:hypothetical protein [Hansschlegelia sp. KR7-227]|jgi:hypothetical protein|uniref:hypothetical protein n=1 Tax=Hansschlegelia sp. KR7-227 TaxID=3400914 RepID=UPI003C04C1B1